ncbi:DNAH6 [Symbiodinium sp. KB8]|nr:DNAH6 [Symbiodinium sp. KB8]
MLCESSAEKNDAQGCSNSTPLSQWASRASQDRVKSPSGEATPNRLTVPGSPTATVPALIEPVVSMMMDISEQLNALAELKRSMARVETAQQRIELALSYQGGAMQEVAHIVSNNNSRSRQPSVDHDGSMASQLSSGVSGGGQSKTAQQVLLPPAPALPGQPPPAHELPDFDPLPFEASVEEAVPHSSAHVLGLPSGCRRSARSHSRQSEGSRMSNTPSVRSDRGDGVQSRAFGQFIAERRGPLASQYGMMEELEEHMGQKLLHRPHRGRAGPKGRSRGHAGSPVIPSVPVPVPVPLRDKKARSASQDSSYPSADNSVGRKQPRRVPTLTSRPGSQGRDKNNLLKDCQSLDALQNQYDASVVATPKSKRPPRWEDACSVPPVSMPSLASKLSKQSKHSERSRRPKLNSAWPREAWLCMCLMGILDFREGILPRLFAFFMNCIWPLMLGVAMVYLWVRNPEPEVYDVATLGCFGLGGVIATLALRRRGLARLVGPVETSLDDYAAEFGFLADWLKLSRRRFWILLVLQLVTVSTRSVYIYVLNVDDDTTEAPLLIMMVTLFTAVSARNAGACYSLVHLCCGLELAIDSFALRFFKDMDFEQALEDWNEVQATLRQVSTKLSDSFIALAAGCVGALVFFAEQAFRQPESLRLSYRSALWIGWLYPPFMMLGYALLRAAAVTEKASRVAPLVNSWKFQDTEDDAAALWMDTDRQYVVQYIIQSQAGFYMKGVRVNAFSVQKIGYYLAAATLGLLSRAG